MSLASPFALAGVAAMAGAVALLCRRTLGPRSLAFATLLSAALAAAIAQFLDARTIVALGLGAASVAAARERASAIVAIGASLGLAALSFVASPSIALATLVALAWSLPASMLSLAAWAAAALAATLAPTDALPPLASRAVLLVLAGAIALAGRRAVDANAAGPGAQRAAVGVVAALPALALLALVFLYERAIHLPRDELWLALAYAAAALLGAAGAGVALLGLVAIASTTNELKLPLLGLVLAAGAGVALLGPRAALVLVPVVATGLAIGAKLAWTWRRKRGAPTPT